MNDRIVGTALFAEYRHAPYCYLYFVAQRAKGGCFTSGIPVVHDGLMKPYRDEACWYYKIDGEQLDVRPGVNINREWSNNASSWSVKFVHLNDDLAKRFRENDPHRLLKRLNPQFFPEAASWT